MDEQRFLIVKFLDGRFETIPIIEGKHNNPKIYVNPEDYKISYELGLIELTHMYYEEDERTPGFEEISLEAWIEVYKPGKV